MTNRANASAKGSAPQSSRSGAGDRRADWSRCACPRSAFIDKVADEGRKNYRDLPWRNIDDAYAVLVSEVMLQQTQVARVLRFWPRWMNLFPTVDALSASDTATVLGAWQGLGYNRRALSLKRACEICSAQRGGQLPETVDGLMTLPGIGPATAAGVMAFARDEPCMYLETNVRSVFLHELFPQSEAVSDKELIPYVIDVCPDVGVRMWYYALLDYGFHLKSCMPNPARRSRHYTRQSAFTGSRREKRSFLLRQVLASEEGIDSEELVSAFAEFEQEAGRAFDRQLCESIVEDLVSEGFIRKEGGVYRA